MRNANLVVIEKGAETNKMLELSFANVSLFRRQRNS